MAVIITSNMQEHNNKQHRRIGHQRGFAVRHLWAQRGKVCQFTLNPSIQSFLNRHLSASATLQLLRMTSVKKLSIVHMSNIQYLWLSVLKLSLPSRQWCCFCLCVFRQVVGRWRFHHLTITLLDRRRKTTMPGCWIASCLRHLLWRYPHWLSDNQTSWDLNTQPEGKPHWTLTPVCARYLVTLHSSYRVKHLFLWAKQINCDVWEKPKVNSATLLKLFCGYFKL